MQHVTNVHLNKNSAYLVTFCFYALRIFYLLT